MVNKTFYNRHHNIHHTFFHFSSFWYFFLSMYISYCKYKWFWILSSSFSYHSSHLFWIISYIKKIFMEIHSLLSKCNNSIARSNRVNLIIMINKITDNLYNIYSLHFLISVNLTFFIQIKKMIEIYLNCY